MDEGRLARVEQKVADHDTQIVRAESTIHELERRVDALTPLLTSVVTLTVEFKNMRQDLSAFMERVEKRDEDHQNERIVSRRWVIGLAVTLMCALIAAAAAIGAGMHA